MSITQIVTAIFRPQRMIGDFAAQVTINENHVDDLQITEHPVEAGAAITDHSFKRPPRLTIRAGWSNSGFAALTNEVTNLINALSGAEVGLGTFNYSRTVYEQILALQESRIPFNISTGKRNYTNMLIESMDVDTNEQTEGSLFVTLHCKNVIIVQTSAVTITPLADQATPSKTAQTVASGTKQALPATPSPGGASPPFGNTLTSAWGGSTEQVIANSGGGV